MLARFPCIMSVSTVEDIMFLFESHGEPLQWVKFACRERSSTKREEAVRQWSTKLDKSLEMICALCGWFLADKGSERDCPVGDRYHPLPIPSSHSTMWARIRMTLILWLIIFDHFLRETPTSNTFHPLHFPIILICNRSAIIETLVTSQVFTTSL